MTALRLRYHTILPLLLWFIFIGARSEAQAQLWSTFGDFPHLSAPASGTPPLNSGFLQPNPWINPPIVDTVFIANAYSFLFDRYLEASPYAPFEFDTAVATHSGWYRYRVREPYHNRTRTDSLFVRFLHDTDVTPVPSDTTLTPTPPGSYTAHIVNLVVLDHYGLTRFRILNLETFERAEVNLFDRTGRAVYRNKNYRNDFDFAKHGPGTYYYQVTLYHNGKVSRQKGFVEVIENNR